MKFVLILLSVLHFGFSASADDDSKYIDCMNLLPPGVTDVAPAATVGRWQIFYDSTRRSNGQETIYVYDRFNKTGSVKEITEDGTCYSKKDSAEAAKGNKVTIGTRADLIKRNFDKYFEDKFVIKDPVGFYKKTISKCPSDVTTPEFLVGLKEKLKLPPDIKPAKSGNVGPGVQ